MSANIVDFNAGINKNDGTTYISNPDVPKDPFEVIIKKITVENVVDRFTKTPKGSPPKTIKFKVIYFENIDCGYVLSSKTVRRWLTELSGGDSKSLIGKKILMFRDMSVSSPQGPGGVRFKRIKEEA